MVLVADPFTTVSPVDRSLLDITTTDTKTARRQFETFIVFLITQSTAFFKTGRDTMLSPFIMYVFLSSMYIFSRNVENIFDDPNSLSADAQNLSKN